MVIANKIILKSQNTRSNQPQYPMDSHTLFYYNYVKKIPIAEYFAIFWFCDAINMLQRAIWQQPQAQEV